MGLKQVLQTWTDKEDIIEKPVGINENYQHVCTVIFKKVTEKREKTSI
jgi:hypothetical protein